MREVLNLSNLLFRNRIDPLVSLSDVQFKRRYRFDKDSVRYILAIIRRHLVPLKVVVKDAA